MMTARIRAAAALVLLALLQPAAATALRSETASQFYLRYRAAFEKARRVEDVTAMLSAKMRQQVEATAPAERAKMFETMKMMGAVTALKITKETATAEGATLTATGLDPNGKATTGTVTLVKEKGEWKLARESWS